MGKLSYLLLQQDVKHQLGLEEKSFYKDEVISNEGYVLSNVITYDGSKSIKSKIFINDINAGFYSSGQTYEKKHGEEWVLFLENYRKVMIYGELKFKYLGLEISCLVEGSIVDIIIPKTKLKGILLPEIKLKKEFILEGSRYKAYTLFSVRVKLTERYETRYEMLKDREWLDYISSVFQECVELNIEQSKQ